METETYPGPQLFSEAVAPAVAVRYPRWVRHVNVKAGEALPAELAACRRIETLTFEGFDGSELPELVGELVHLRHLSLKNATKLTRLPRSLFALPRLTHLDLGGSGISELDGVEQAPSLRRISLPDTPLGNDETKREALRARFAKTITSSAYGPFEILVPRDVPAPPKDKDSLLAAVRDEAFDTRSVLNGADLSGATFEDVRLMVDELKKANLANTTWRRCELQADLEGANLEGAVFEDCVLPARMMKVQAKNATFDRCLFSMTSLTKANLCGARLRAVRPGSTLDLEKAEARDLVLEVFIDDLVFAKHIQGPKADLEGATITFDLTPEARAALEQNPNPKAAWPKDPFKGAKTNDATRIVLAPLPGAKATTKAAAKPSAKKTNAQPIGRIDAPDAALWFLALDAAAAAGWKGEHDRAMAALDENKTELTVGKAKAVLCEVSDRGWSYIWRIDGGIALLEHHAKDGVAKDDLAEALASRVAELPARGEPIHLGSVAVKSGALALLLPHTTGDFTAEELNEAKSGDDAVEVDEGRVLVPLAKGTYEVFVDSFGDPPPEDELGRYLSRLRIVKKR